MDRIVFNQGELESAVSSGIAVIYLCDNDFILPSAPGISYGAIGTVTASIGMTADLARDNGISFLGFTPVFDPCVHVAHGIRPQQTPSSFSSFSSSFAGSFTGSFPGIWGSFSSSFTSSFAGSFTSSFASSFSGSFSLTKRYIIKTIAVNGYGLDLI